MKAIACFLLLLLGADGLLRADDFYTIERLRYLDKPGSAPVVPCLEVLVSVKGPAKTSATTAHVYFYDQNTNLMTTMDSPTQATWGPYINQDRKEVLYFAVPDQVVAAPGWLAVVVFGDGKGVDAQCYPTATVTDYDFPEKNLFDRDGPPIERKVEMDPLVQYTVQTKNPDQPTLTLFMRPPPGITDAKQAKGVLAMCLLAGHVDDVKTQLEGGQAQAQLSPVIKFAEDHKLIIICWGSRGLWDPTKNWDQQKSDARYYTDKGFDQVADAWAEGIQSLVKLYGIPDHNYLLWGLSGSAQYACRLALRKPEYFLAIHAHVPSSFDKPTPEASRVLWCLTTGELEAGHERSLRFYAQCRALGYPIIYKAYVGLGHAWSPVAQDFGLKFFDYALTVQNQRLAYDQTLADPNAQFQMAQTSAGPIEPWIASFRRPTYVGDVINQEVFPADQTDMVPPALRTPLPTKELADAWNQ